MPTATTTQKPRRTRRTRAQIDADNKRIAEQKAAEKAAEAEPLNHDEVEVTVEDGTLEADEKDVEEVIKESHMGIQAELVPGRVAVAALTPDKLKALAFISTYTTVDEQSTSPRQHGYQREPMAERFPGIGRYYAKEDNRHLITPLITSVRVYDPKARARFNFLFNRGDVAAIHQEFGKSVFSIVDGQHRLGGLYWAWENMSDFEADVPVHMFYGLHYEDEAKLFDDVNTNQRKLPKALIEATKVHMEAGEKSHAQTIREVTFALAQDGDSVWHGLVNMTGQKEKKGDPKLPVTYEGLRRATGNMLPERVVGRLEARGFQLDNVAKNYWQTVTRACAPAWNERPRLVETEEGEKVEEAVKYRIKDLVGVAALSRLGADVLTTALDQSRTTEEFWSAVADMTSRLGAVDWEKRQGNPWQYASAGFAGMGILYNVLYDLVYLDKSPGVAVAPDER